MVLRVKVKTRSRSSDLEEATDGGWIAHLKSPPVDGKANAELIGLIAERFGVRRAAIAIKSGAGARLKLVEIRP